MQYFLPKQTIWRPEAIEAKKKKRLFLRGPQHYENSWKIIEKTSGFNPINLQCKICLSEIVNILNPTLNPNQHSLNKRNKTVSHCRHLKKYLLSKAQFYYLKGSTFEIFQMSHYVKR